MPGVELRAEQVRPDASVPGRTPSSCISRANMSVPTTEAALLRVTVDSISPNAATPASAMA